MSDLKRFLLFSLGQQEYAIPLSSVREAIALPADVTGVPHSLPHFLGIIDLRGTVVPLIDLRVKFGMRASEIANDDDTGVVICSLPTMVCGIVVSSISAVISLGSSEIGAPPDFQNARDAGYILGVIRRNERLVLLLDIDKVLDTSDHAGLREAVKVRAAQ